MLKFLRNLVFAVAGFVLLVVAINVVILCVIVYAI